MFDFEYVSGPRFNLFSLLRIVAVYGSYILCNIGFDWIVGFRETGVVGIHLIDFIIFVVIFTEELYVAHKRQLLSKTVREIAIHEQLASWRSYVVEGLTYGVPIGIIWSLFSGRWIYGLVFTVILVSLLPFVLFGITKLTSRFRSLFFEVMPELVLIVGSGKQTMAFVKAMENRFPKLADRIKILDSTWIGNGTHKSPPGKFFKGIREVKEILKEEAIDRVYILLPIRSCYDDVIFVIQACLEQGVAVVVRPIFDLEGLKGFVRQDSLTRDGTYELATGSPLLYSMPHRMIKRLMDITIASLAIIFTSPLMLATALFVKLSSPGPVFFKQVRLGYRKRPFTVYKFRTMYEDAEQRVAELEAQSETGGAAFKMRHDPRITPVGRILRCFSIDELPQLFNVLKGDMSLVGPRPLPVRDHERFKDYKHFRRMAVRPGITGLWQVSGRGNVPFNEWMQMELDYIDNWSLKMDLSILFKTIRAVFTGHGAV